VKPINVYEVVGPQAYRGHAPGTVFPGTPGRAAETRALVRGNIRLVETIGADLPDIYRLPEGWAA
jgi:hypothetical protein